MDRLTSAGVTFSGDIRDRDWGMIAPFNDIEGNDLQLCEPPRGC